MSFKRTPLILVSVLLLLFALVQIAQAGFGISPPYVKNENLFPGATYEQKIILSRGQPDEDWQATVSIDAPEIENWLTIEPGKEFILPKGKQAVPMFVKVQVPKDADYKRYQGYIRVVAKSAEKKPGVTIALGGRIDVVLDVTQEKIIDFLIRIVEIPKLEEGWPVKVLMKVENKGNVPITPSKVGIEIFDLSEKNLLYTGETQDLSPKVEPFKTSETFASFPAQLSVGHYWAKVKIFKENELLRDEKIIFEVVPKGTLKTEKEFKIPPLVGVIVGLIILIIIGYLIFKKRKNKK